MSQLTSIFRGITFMEPLLPVSGRGELAELSVEIFRKSGELAATLPAKSVRTGVAALVREMNSYYSNLIEGHKTLPKDIARALRNEMSEREDDRRNQLLSVAHIRTGCGHCPAGSPGPNRPISSTCRQPISNGQAISTAGATSATPRFPASVVFSWSAP